MCFGASGPQHNPAHPVGINAQNIRLKKTPASHLLPASVLGGPDHQTGCHIIGGFRTIRQAPVGLGVCLYGVSEPTLTFLDLYLSGLSREKGFFIKGLRPP